MPLGISLDDSILQQLRNSSADDLNRLFDSLLLDKFNYFESLVEKKLLIKVKRFPNDLSFLLFTIEAIFRLVVI